MSTNRLLRDEPLFFERNKTRSERGTFLFPPLDVPVVDPATANDPAMLREAFPEFPDVSELDVVRHFHRLSQRNFAIDEGAYPLGSCTMKYNPRANERAARFKGFCDIHPLQPEDQIQGMLQAIWELEQALVAITGMDSVTSQPAAGAHGELTAMLLIKKALEARGEGRRTVICPDSAHGTNPASAVFAGYGVAEVASGADGTIDLAQLSGMVDENTAAVMITVPSTLGIFEHNIRKVADLMHSKGGFVYIDGANLNSFVGRALPGLMGADAIHINLHKTFSTPHGGGGPGAGPVALSKALTPYRPVPRIEKDGDLFRLLWEDSLSIGSMRGFLGNVLVLIRALAYIRSLGADGLRAMSAAAVLNANLVRKRLEGAYNLPYTNPCLHEVVFDDSLQRPHGVNNADIAKRLIDFGFHPPTMSFPLVVHGALMIEPTDSEPTSEIEAFCDAMLQIAREAEENPDLLHSAPHTAPVSRVDEVQAARNLKLRWTPED